jgi:hypothetical protein
MARWTLYENRHGSLSLKYKNSLGKVFACGDVRLDTAPITIVQWLVEHDVAAGDTVHFDDGTALFIQGEGARA